MNNKIPQIGIVIGLIVTVIGMIKFFDFPAPVYVMQVSIGLFCILASWITHEIDFLIGQISEIDSEQGKIVEILRKKNEHNAPKSRRKRASRHDY